MCKRLLTKQGNLFIALLFAIFFVLDVIMGFPILASIDLLFIVINLYSAWSKHKDETKIIVDTK